MLYSVCLGSNAVRDLRSVTQDMRTRIASAISGLASEPRPAGCKKLTDRPGWRIRVGSYRVLYEIDDAERTVSVFRIAPRDRAY